jgi:solute carrier family 35 protein E3
MAERAADREPSISSSVTEAETFDDNEKHGTEGSFVKVKTPEEVEHGDDVERAELLREDHEKPAAPPKPDNSTRSAIIWMVVNTLATIGIVSLEAIPAVRPCN